MERSKISYGYCSYSVRTFNKLWFINLPLRFVCDLVKISLHLSRLKKNTIIHFIADGGFAVYRTLAVSFVAKILSCPVVIDARGNSLNNFSEGKEVLFSRISWALILNLSKFFLVQQKHTYQSLCEKFNNKVIHHPNCIKERPSSRSYEILNSNKIKIGFVGYCYRKKGVFNLIEGCNTASGIGAKIELTLIGEEEHSFSTFLDDFKGNANLTLRRLGRKSFDVVQQEMDKLDIFVFPSFHPGEGHPNIINEAMSAQLAIITTKAGAIGEFLNVERCYFIKPHSADDIAEQILNILSDPYEAKKKAKEASQYLKSNFSESVVYGELLKIYGELIKCAV